MPACLSAYQPSSENLVVNGDFSLDVLNGGFGWLYRQSRDVSFALDPTQPHSGNRSLRMAVRKSRGLEDAGLQQLIPVQPRTRLRILRELSLSGHGRSGRPAVRFAGYVWPNRIF